MFCYIITTNLKFIISHQPSLLFRESFNLIFLPLPVLKSMFGPIIVVLINNVSSFNVNDY